MPVTSLESTRDVTALAAPAHSPGGRRRPPSIHPVFGQAEARGFVAANKALISGARVRVIFILRLMFVRSPETPPRAAPSTPQVHERGYSEMSRHQACIMANILNGL
jgi:hypothetical protein